MHPWLIYPYISMYGLCIVAGLVAAWIWARGNAGRQGMDASRIDLLVPLLAGTGMLGAWLFGAWTDAATGEESHAAVLVGSLLFATAAGIFYGVMVHVPLGTLGDICASPLALGIGIGRVGCFFAGCCYGKVCTHPTVFMAIQFPTGSIPFLAQVRAGELSSDACASLAVYPVQLYESFLCVLLALAVWRMARRREWLSGELFLSVGFGYGAIRFILEFFRGDNPPIHSMTFSQWITLAIAALAAITLAIRRRWSAQLGLRELGPSSCDYPTRA